MSQPDPAEVPWDISFLRPGALVTAGLAVVAAPVAGALAGWDAVWGVLLGAVLVTAFFAASSAAVAWAGRIGDTLTLPVALLVFGVKATVLFGVLNALPADGWIDRRALAWTVVAGALVWSAFQLRWVWTRQLYYVPPPAPPRPAAGSPGRADQEHPSRRG
ncbi:hypothetical protein E9529_02985 [Blastococcus sp. KM273128]|uniref:hypothetical protein n=1 Tax=Blastococcus sp. KM273128 TaxID=2570314 RepID=UPI001F40ED8E|nr:hypothetical protein [Blastococcus sp. KM273128]MCF6743253.1 hypothetical protein [Blastococcus sp. KM273128]